MKRYGILVTQDTDHATFTVEAESIGAAALQQLAATNMARAITRISALCKEGKPFPEQILEQIGGIASDVLAVTRLPTSVAIPNEPEPATDKPGPREIGRSDTFDHAVERFLEAAQLKVDAHYLGKRVPGDNTLRLSPGGTRYIRVVSAHSVYCFIDRTTGNVLKAKSWKAPELKNPRSNVYDDDHGSSGVDWHGAVYLR